MNKMFFGFLVIILSIYSFTPSLPALADNSPVDLADSIVEDITESTGVDVSNQDLTKFDEDFNFLIEDPVFLEMEEFLILDEQDISVYEDGVQGQWVPIAAAAIRLLTSKVGRAGMQRGWALARPHVQKALNAPKNYILEGSGSGGRIIQVRNRKGGSVVFRLDYFPVKHGGKDYLHYHVPPNLSTHHIIKF